MKMRTWIEWVEPFGPNSEPVYMRVSKETAIAVMKNLHPGIYDNDSVALEDFIAVHWARQRDENERSHIGTEDS